MFVDIFVYVSLLLRPLSHACERQPVCFLLDKYKGAVCQHSENAVMSSNTAQWYGGIHTVYTQLHIVYCQCVR